MPPPPPHAYGPPRHEHPDGTTVLVLGILSVTICQLLGPIAWAKGNAALSEIDRAPYAYTDRSSVVTGRICGMVATGLLASSVLLIIALAAFAAATS
jgi:hypothetical protein